MRVELEPTPEPVTLAAEVSSRQDRFMSFALLCPCCGELWGRVVRGKGWHALLRPCGQCRQGDDVSGSFFQRFGWLGGEPIEHFLARHPQMAQYEFGVHLAWAERYATARKGIEGEPL